MIFLGSFSLVLHNIVGSHKKCLSKVIQMSIHNIFFFNEKKKKKIRIIIPELSLNSLP